MRVVAGEFGGRKIKRVPGENTRPTSDKVKEASFQRMGPFFNKGSCLDLFAGSGSLGIEALSRGMDSAVFIDTHPQAIRTIHDNIKTLQVEDRCTIKKRDALRALDACAKEGMAFDLILIDPPFHSDLYEKILRKIHSEGILQTNGVIYCEHDRQLAIDWDLLPYIIHHSSTYGTITTKLLKKQ